MTTIPAEQHRGRVRAEPCAKRVRAYLDGHLVVDSRRPTMVWEVPWGPTYYFPEDDVRAELIPTGKIENSPSRGDAHIHDVRVGGSVAAGAGRRHPESPLEAIRPLVRLEWDALTLWLEEDEVVHTHPRDPYHRLDICSSSRHIEVSVDGVMVADSVRPVLLFETGLPARYYLPPSDCRLDLLRPTTTETHCPYKGMARYYSVEVGPEPHQELVWSYPNPLPESVRVAGLLSFYNEKVDIVVDDEPEVRPHTQFG